jgi:hypothetical protein
LLNGGMVGVESMKVFNYILDNQPSKISQDIMFVFYDEKDEVKNMNVIYSNAKKRLKNNNANFSLVRSNNKTLHDRWLFSNYFFISSGFGFNLYKGVSTNINVHSILNNNTKKMVEDFLGKISNYVSELHSSNEVSKKGQPLLEWQPNIKPNNRLFPPYKSIFDF